MTTTINVYKVRGGVPLLLCSRCCATMDLLKAGFKPPKKRFYRRWRVAPGHHKRELVITSPDGVYGGLINQIDRTNSPKFKVTYFINGVKVKYEMFNTHPTARLHRNYFIKNEGKFMKNGKEGGMPVDNMPKSEKEHKYQKKNANALRYIREYSSIHYRQINVKFNIETDNDLLEELDSSSSKAETIRKWYYAYHNQK